MNGSGGSPIEQTQEDPPKRKVFLVEKNAEKLINKQENPDPEKFQCLYDHCDKVYKSKENLLLHIKNKHLKEKPFKCTHCDSSFSHRNGRIYHIRKRHLNYLPFKCTMDECPSAFASRSALKYHIDFQHYKQKEKEMIKKIMSHLEHEEGLVSTTNNHNHLKSSKFIVMTIKPDKKL